MRKLIVSSVVLLSAFGAGASRPQIFSLAYSPDGKSIAARVQRKDKTGQIGLLSVPDGALRILKSVDWRGASTLAFSPDGKYVAYDLPASADTDQRDIFVDLGEFATDYSHIPAD